MKKKGGKSCGAVSVFLTIILVPCIIVTCAFDDISRVQLSKAGAASAADLALYSLMADYDVDLKDYYGLVASSQNIEDFYEKTAAYFSGMMDAKGVSGEGSQLFSEYLKGLYKDGTVSDFLQVEFVEAASVSAAENAQMGENPALIEDGIVEFMKYRGPAAIVKKLLDRFTSLDLNKSSTVDKDSEIVEKKENYANAEGDLLNAALYTYIAIHQYEEAWQMGNPLAENGYSGMCEVLAQIWNDLQKVTELTTTYYFADTDRLKRIPFPVYNNIDAYSVKPEDIGEAVAKEGGGEIYCVNTKILKEILEGMDDEIEAVQDAQQEAADQFPQLSDGGNPAVYMLEVQDVFASSSQLQVIRKNMERLLKRYALIQAALKCVPFPEGSDLPTDWVKQLNDAGMDIKDLQKTLSDAGSSSYINCVRTYNSCAGMHYDKIRNKSYTFDSSLTGSTQTLSSFAAQIASRMPELQSELQELIDKLTVAINGGKVEVNGEKKKVVSLEELAQKAADYQTAREEWGAAADSYQNDTEYAKQESDAYHGNQNGGSQKSAEEKMSEEMAAQISKEAVYELKERLTNIRADMQNFLKALDEFTYGKEKVCKIQTADQLVNLGRKAMPSRSSSLLSQNRTDADGYFLSLIHPQTNEIFHASGENRGKNGNHPDLRIATPDLYAYLKSRFGGNKSIEVEAEKKKNDEQNEGYKNDAAKEEENAKEVDNTILSGKGEDINGGHEEKKVTIGTAVSSIATLVSNIISGNADEMRDQLFVCEYIMDMFSYATINLEEKYKPAKNNSTTSSQEPAVQTQTGQDGNQKETVHLSLTNRAIDHDHNRANLGEVEYILYGYPSIDTNLNTSYRNIYVWRLALNTVSGFINFYNGDNATAKAIQAVAAAVAAATAGVVPVPVTKCVLIGVLAAMESAHDLNQLKKGAPVLFYKAKDKEWSYAFHASSGSTSGSFSLTNNQEQNNDKGLYYSDYMYLFLMIGLTSDVYPDMLLRTGDLIEANMRMSGDSNKEFDLNKSLCYFHLKAKLRVKPLMLTLPIVNSINGADPSGVLENKDWCTYDVDIYRGYS